MAGRRNPDVAIASLDLYDLVKHHYGPSWDRVDDALAGVRTMLLNALMHGLPAAGGDIVKDFFLWEEEVRLEVEAYASEPGRFLCEAGQNPSFGAFDAARVMIGNQPWVADEHAPRLDFFSALVGDMEAARRVEDVFGSKPGIMAAFS